MDGVSVNHYFPGLKTRAPAGVLGEYDAIGR